MDSSADSASTPQEGGLPTDQPTPDADADALHGRCELTLRLSKNMFRVRLGWCDVPDRPDVATLDIHVSLLGTPYSGHAARVVPRAVVNLLWSPASRVRVSMYSRRFEGGGTVGGGTVGVRFEPVVDDERDRGDEFALRVELR